MASVNVKQDPAAPIAKDVLAKAIIDISTAAQALQRGGLNQRAVVVLLHDSTNVPMRDIKYVLNGLAQLRKDYCA